MAHAVSLIAHHDHQPQLSLGGYEFKGVPNLFTVTHKGVFQGIIDDNRAISLGRRPGWERWCKFDKQNPPAVYKGLIHRAEFQLVEFTRGEGSTNTFHVIVADPKPFPATIYALISTGVHKVTAEKSAFKVVASKFPHGIVPISGEMRQIDGGDFIYRGSVHTKEEIWAFKEGDVAGVIFADGVCRVLRCQKGGGPMKEWLELRLEDDQAFTDKMTQEFKEKRAVAAKEAEDARIASEAVEAERTKSLDRQVEMAVAAAKAREEGQIIDLALQIAERFPDDLNREDIELFDDTEQHPLSREVFFSAICDKIMEMLGRAKKQGTWSKFHCYLLHVLADYADKGRVALEVGDFVRELDVKTSVPIGVMEKLAPASMTVSNHSPERAKRETRRAELRSNRLELAPAKGPSGSKTNLGAEARARRDREAASKNRK